jgi:hypothetical protein
MFFDSFYSVSKNWSAVLINVSRARTGTTTTTTVPLILLKYILYYREALTK